MRPDGLPFADTVADLTAGKIFYPPRLDEFGIDLVTGSFGITGTRADGTVETGFTCTDWITTSGNLSLGKVDATTGLWTTGFSTVCITPRRLYCFGTDFTEPVSPPASTGRLAFVSSVPFNPGTGIAAADTICEGDAATAALPGTYKALLATELFTAADRVSPIGSTWVRPDGVSVVAQPSDLTGPQLLAPINLQADGVTYVGNINVWKGAADFNTSGTAATSCTSWNVTTGDGPTNIAAFSLHRIAPFTLSCSNAIAGRVYCFQE